jgi:hypothetical protein
MMIAKLAAAACIHMLEMNTASDADEVLTVHAQGKCTCFKI